MPENANAIVNPEIMMCDRIVDSPLGIVRSHIHCLSHGLNHRLKSIDALRRDKIGLDLF